jgi:hypothetical protein
MRKVLFLAVMFAFVLTSSAWAADVSGNWTLKMTGPSGEESVPLVIKATGETLTVTGTHTSFGAMTGTGTIKGNAISFNLKSQMEFKFTGTVSGDTMKGTREVSMGSGGQGGAGGGQGGAAGGQAAGGQGGAPAAGGQQGGQAAGGQGGAPAAGGQQGGQAAGGQAAGGQGGAAGGGQGGGQTMSADWTATRTK